MQRKVPKERRGGTSPPQPASSYRSESPHSAAWQQGQGRGVRNCLCTSHHLDASPWAAPCHVPLFQDSQDAVQLAAGPGESGAGGGTHGPRPQRASLIWCRPRLQFASSPCDGAVLIRTPGYLRAADISQIQAAHSVGAGVWGPLHLEKWNRVSQCALRWGPAQLKITHESGFPSHFLDSSRIFWHCHFSVCDPLGTGTLIGCSNFLPGH